MPKCGQAGRTRWDDLAVDRHHHGFFKTAFLSVDVGRHLLKRQGALDEHHLAVGPVGNALGFDVERLDLKYVGWVVRRRARLLDGLSSVIPNCLRLRYHFPDTRKGMIHGTSHLHRR
jgi:hypothetical protein